MEDYACSIDERLNYLFVTVTGPNVPDTILRYSADVRAACLRTGLTRVLVVVNLRGNGMTLLDVYKAVAEGSDQSAGIGMRCAYVDPNPEHSAETMHLAEAVAATRGILVRTFRNVAEAESWLLGSASADHRAL
jgi:hypothetical protein